jgi:hypothetical protein
LKYISLRIIAQVGLLLMLSTACKNEPEEQEELRGFTYDQMQQGVLENKIIVPANIPYYSIDGSLVTDNIGNANLTNPIATTWFINEKDAIVKVQILDSKRAAEQLRANPFVKELNSLDCSSLKSTLDRLGHRASIENIDGTLNTLLEEQNIDALTFILKTCGFPTIQTAGEDGVQIAWNVLQNVPVEIRSLYFPQVIEASKKGDLERQDVALMQDKMLMDYGKPQLYGSQVLRDDSGNFTLYNLEKPMEVDARRAIMGMTPLADYLVHFKIDFDVIQKDK